MPPRALNRVCGIGRAALLLMLLTVPAWTAPANVSKPMPDFSDRRTQAWLNSAPLSRADLLGKVVLIEAWSVS